jgi:hypothetical protein
MMLGYETAVTYLDAYENEYPVDILLTYKKKWLEQYINKIVRFKLLEGGWAVYLAGQS